MILDEAQSDGDEMSDEVTQNLKNLLNPHSTPHAYLHIPHNSTRIPSIYT